MTLDDVEEFVIVVMLVPVIFALHDAKSHDRTVHSDRRLVIPLILAGINQSLYIHQLKLVIVRIEMCGVRVRCLRTAGSFRHECLSFPRLARSVELWNDR